jgi:hypothetical protein
MKDEWPQYLALEFDCEICSKDRDFFGTGVAWVKLIRYRRFEAQRGPKRRESLQTLSVVYIPERHVITGKKRRGTMSYGSADPALSRHGQMEREGIGRYLKEPDGIGEPNNNQ